MERRIVPRKAVAPKFPLLADAVTMRWEGVRQVTLRARSLVRFVADAG